MNELAPTRNGIYNINKDNAAQNTSPATTPRRLSGRLLVGPFDFSRIEHCCMRKVILHCGLLYFRTTCILTVIS